MRQGCVTHNVCRNAVYSDTRKTWTLRNQQFTQDAEENLLPILRRSELCKRSQLQQKSFWWNAPEMRWGYFGAKIGVSDEYKHGLTVPKTHTHMP